MTRRGWALSRVCYAATALALAASSLAAQTISGRVSDASGAPIPHVRVMAYPVGDSSEVATRIAFTNAQGEFTLRLNEHRAYVLRVRRIGFAPEPDRKVDLTNAIESRVVITLQGIAVALAPVRVTGRASKARCLAVDDTAQNPRVREWLDQALFALHARRVAERDLTYKVQITQTRSPAAAGETYAYTHRPGARSNQWLEDDAANLAGLFRAVAQSHGGDFMPTETTILSPTFRSSHCFENVIAPNADGTWQMQLHELTTLPGQAAIAGSLTFTADGLTIATADFRAANGGTVVSTAHLGFTQVSVDGESFPIISARSIAHVVQGTGKNDRRETGVSQVLSYSSFTRAP